MEKSRIVPLKAIPTGLPTPFANAAVETPQAITVDDQVVQNLSGSDECLVPEKVNALGKRMSYNQRLACRLTDFYGCPFNSFLTLLVCLQCSDNDFGGGVVTKDVFYEPEKITKYLMLTFVRILSGTPSAVKKLLSAVNA